MIKPNRLKKGDKIAIVSLSKGVLGEPFAAHEKKLIEERLGSIFGLDFEYMPSSLKGIEYLEKHPEARAEDLKTAFKDPSIKAIWCAIGGDDTYRTLPYLMNDEFKKLIHENPKPFLGFSDTTTNHLMFYRLGLMTYYAPALLPDVAELGPDMLPYTVEWLNELFSPTANKEIKPSPVWYSPRVDFSVESLGVPLREHPETHGFIFSGSGAIEGELLGGCLESLSESLVPDRYADQKEIFEKYPLFPERDAWRGKVLFVETSEETPTPERHLKMLENLEKAGVFDEIKGLISGKPMDEKYFDEYLENLSALAARHHLPFVYNLNYGHANPRMIVPYGQPIKIDFDAKTLHLLEPILN